MKRGDLALGALGIGLLFLVLTTDSDTSSQPEPPKPPDEPPPAPEPAQPKPTEPKPDQLTELLNAPQADPPRFSWTLASVALAGEDKYNAEAERKARKIRLANDPGAKLVNGFQKLVYFIANLAYPGAGVALEAIFTGFGVIASDVIKSRGGFEDLPGLTRKRAALYGNIMVASRALPGVDKQRRYRDAATIDHYKQLISWYRANLEWQRIISTPDEAIMPVAMIAYLKQEQLWPPPVEPIALRSSDARFQYSRFPAVVNWIGLNPIESYVTDSGLAQQAFDELMTDFGTKYSDYRVLIAALALPDEVAQVMAASGSLPRYGSTLFPVMATQAGDSL